MGRTSARPAVCAVLSSLLFGAGVSFAAQATRLAADDPAFESAARALAKGQKLLVDGLLLEQERATIALELERVEVWREDAVVLVDGRRVGVPKTVYFRGKVAGEPESAVLLSVREKGGAMGMLFRGDRAWALGKGKGQGALRTRRSRPEELQKPFECGLDALGAPELRLGVEEPAPAVAATVPDEAYDATVAVETDYEYYALFNDTADALDYMGDLFGYADLVYSREVDTDMFIGFARLWTGGAGSDPWAATTSSNALNEFRAYWNANMTGTKRTTAHMLSGKSTGGGVAWVGVLCDNYGSPGSSYDYGYSGALGGNFNWDGNQAHNPATVVWDIMVVQHEIGHNFNSPHTHDYCNVGGSSQPIDRCYQGCAGAGTGLPSCSGPTPFFNGGAGTIMSYCHLLGGGYNNQAMSFGEGHTCGVLPGRQADRMSAHVVARGNAHPSCFVSSSCGNGAIDAGEECDSGNLNGATCASRGFVGGTLSCSSTCTFDTSQCHECGNNVVDASETCDGSALGGATCTSLGCTGGALACNPTCTGYDKTFCSGCAPCDDDDVCEAGEDCLGCPGDCAGGTTSGAVCGNGLCEAGNGEDCASCPSDCRGVQSGNPNGRYCCGDGGGTNPVACSDARCTSSGYACTTNPTTPGSFCCGDDSCSNGESCSVCSLDCALAAEVCGNGIDDDCSGQADCSDAACSGTPACACAPAGQACSASSECCSNNCRTKGKNAGTCA